MLNLKFEEAQGNVLLKMIGCAWFSLCLLGVHALDNPPMKQFLRHKEA